MRYGRYGRLVALALAAQATLAPAQVRVPGDPLAAEPSGIVADPCPARPTPTDPAGWTMWNIHMLTRDFGQLCRYRAANAALEARGVRPQLVLFGDSLTDNWQNLDPPLFGDRLTNRGISGQTTPQMLVRFREDVLALRPKAVHILAGTNDVAGNTGPTTLETVEGNIQTMAELARAHGIHVILASVLPAAAFPWAPTQRPAPQVAALNRWLRDYAARNGDTYVDYHAALTDGRGGMRPGLSSDGVHPTVAGYAIMRPLLLAALARTPAGEAGR